MSFGREATPFYIHLEVLCSLPLAKVCNGSFLEMYSHFHHSVYSTQKFHTITVGLFSSFDSDQRKTVEYDLRRGAPISAPIGEYGGLVNIRVPHVSNRMGNNLHAGVDFERCLWMGPLIALLGTWKG